MAWVLLPYSVESLEYDGHSFLKYDRIEVPINPEDFASIVSAVIFAAYSQSPRRAYLR